MVDNYDHAENGRIWVIWYDAKARVHVINQSDQFMYCHVTLVNSKVSFVLTVIYSWNTAACRVSLWRDLKQLSNSISKPWVLMGDLNTTLFQDERIKNGQFIISNTSELQSFVQDVNVRDIKFSGIRLTWCNN